MVKEIALRPQSPPLGVADLRRGIVLAGAAEQMFFFDAPLAHVVAYEERQRGLRREQAYRRQRRPSRLNLVPLPSENGA
jgi:hypothetical protein